MPILSIRLYPDPILRKKTAPVSRITAEIEDLLSDMIQTMHASPATIGLAAPQVGHPVSVIVVDVTPKEKRHGLIVLLNPVLVAGDGKKILREGCLSLPDYTGNVTRFERVTVQGKNRQGIKVEFSTSGVEAICLQHEIDHINGLMFLDRVDSLKTDIFRRKRYL
jgi:peptide deformylase